MRQTQLYKSVRIKQMMDNDQHTPQPPTPFLKPLIKSCAYSSAQELFQHPDLRGLQQDRIRQVDK